MKLLKLILISLLFISGVHAQPWPAKPVRIIVPGPAGSAPDIVARLLGEKLTPIWGQNLVVDNRIGAAGNVGHAAAAGAPADGYTLLFGLSAALALNQHTFKQLPFSPEKDFVPVVSLGISPMMIAVNGELPVKSVAELVALARAQPGKVNFGTSSSKNVAHLTGVLLASKAGVQLVHVPYRTNAQAAAEATAGLTQLYIDGIPPMLGHMKAGRLRVIAVSSARRLPNFPDIPAVSETLPGFSFVGWFALMAPAATPQEVVAKINRDVNQVLKDPDIAARLAGFGIYDPGGTPDELARFIRAERQNFAQAVKTAGIEPE